VKFISYLPQVKLQIDAMGRKRMLDASIGARDAVVKSFTGARTGRRYHVPGTRVMYTASAPGERPAKPTGRLSKEVFYRVGAEGNKLRGIVGTDYDVGKILETKPVRRGGRPWLEPGMKDARPEILKRLNKRWF